MRDRGDGRSHCDSSWLLEAQVKNTLSVTLTLTLSLINPCTTVPQLSWPARLQLSQCLELACIPRPHDLVPGSSTITSRGMVRARVKGSGLETWFVSFRVSGLIFHVGGEEVRASRWLQMHLACTRKASHVLIDISLSEILSKCAFLGSDLRIPPRAPSIALTQTRDSP